MKRIIILLILLASLHSQAFAGDYKMDSQKWQKVHEDASYITYFEILNIKYSPGVVITRLFELCKDSREYDIVHSILIERVGNKYSYTNLDYQYLTSIPPIGIKPGISFLASSGSTMEIICSKIFDSYKDVLK